MRQSYTSTVSAVLSRNQSQGSPCSSLHCFPSFPALRCTLINAASSAVCEACSHRRQGGPLAEDFPSLGSPSGSAGGGRGASGGPPPQQQAEAAAGKLQGGSGKGGKGKGTVLNIGSQRGQGAGRTMPAAAAPPPPPSVWGGGQDNAALKKRAEEERKILAGQAAARGQWAQSGGARLARSVGAINDAWGE